MGKVVTFPGHYMELIPGHLGELGGLKQCKRCGGVEAALPTECPGRSLTIDEMNKITDGELDYTLKEGWHNPNGDDIVFLP